MTVESPESVKTPSGTKAGLEPRPHTSPGPPKGKDRVGKAADTLEQKARDLASAGGLKAKLGRELVEDADFLRRIKPKLIVERVRGERPGVDSQRTTARLSESKTKQPTPRSSPARPGKSSSKSPFLVIGAGLAAGATLAKLVDWRGHAHPRS